jgi:hypothetical protein
MSLPPSNAKARIYVRFRNSIVPGAPIDRLLQLLKDVYQYIGQEFSSTLDYVHIPGTIDSQNSQITWLVIDLNVGEKGQDLNNIPIYCFRLRYLDGNP